MGRRTEPRIAVSLPVLVRGIDSRGIPFTLKTETLDISFSGASLKGLADPVTLGMKLELECQGRKTWYRVEWIRNGTPPNGAVGIRSLEPGRYIWGIAPKGWEPDTYDESTPSPAEVVSISNSAAIKPWRGPERRRFARHPCRMEVQIGTQEGEAYSTGVITEICLGGCYVEMLSPLPADTAIRLSFKLHDAALDLQGSVASSQMGMGMGVAFTSMTPTEFETLRQFAPPAAPPAHAAQQPKQALEEKPVSAPPPNATEALNALVYLLLRKGIVTRQELSDELDKLRGRGVGTPA